jgi:hypothetical protein
MKRYYEIIFFEHLSYHYMKMFEISVVESLHVDLSFSGSMVLKIFIYFPYILIIIFSLYTNHDTYI